MENRLRELEKAGDYKALIEELRYRINKDQRVLESPYVKEWCGRRWRNLFIQEAVKDKNAVKRATKSLFPRIKAKRTKPQLIAERFLKGESIQEWKIEMPEAQFNDQINTTLVFCPGFINGLLPVRAFQDEFPNITKKYGWNIFRADSHPVRSCEANNEDILKAIDDGVGLCADPEIERRGPPPKDVILMGYSKGSADILSLLYNHPDLKNKVRAVITWVGGIGGSHTGDNIYNLIKKLDFNAIDSKLDRFIGMLPPSIKSKITPKRYDEYDFKGAVHSVTTQVRSQFIEEQGSFLNDLNIPFFNVSAATSMLEVPTFLMQDVLNISRYDANNDMMLTQQQSILNIPMSTHLGIVRGNHWDVSYPPFPALARLVSPNLDHPFPRKAAVMSLFKFLAELGVID